jgi:hypothetical protein
MVSPPLKRGNKKKKHFPLSLVKERGLGGEVESIAIYPLDSTLKFNIYN